MIKVSVKVYAIVLRKGHDFSRTKLVQKENNTARLFVERKKRTIRLKCFISMFVASVMAMWLKY